MSSIYQKLGAGQTAFTAEAQDGDYVTEYPLGAAEPTHVLIKAVFKQFRADYTRPAANTTLTYGGLTAYFIDDVGFTDERGGLCSWTRLWATIPASWSEPGGTYAYAFPAFTAVYSLGNTFPVSNIVANASNYSVNTNATGISTSDDVFFDLNYVRNSQNYHVTFTTPALFASSGVNVTIPGILPGTGSFSGPTGTVRKGNKGRDLPATDSVDSFVLHDYALSSETTLDTDLPQIKAFAPITAGVPTETQYLVSTTLPSTTQYQSMISAGTLIVVQPSDRTRYLGNIYERTTRLVKAK